MSTDYLSLFARMTAGEALLHLRDMYEDLEEDIYDIYVVDETNGLVGHLGVKELITADPTIIVAEVMDTNVVSVTTTTDQEEAAEKLGHYDLLSLPVVDEDGKLRGIIMADDVIDVLKEEATEDIYQSSGIASQGGDSQDMLGHHVGKAFGARLPWLIATLCIETGAAGVITHYDAVFRDTVAAASFMPLLSGVTGSVATQSTCIIIRGTKDKSSLNLKLILDKYVVQPFAPPTWYHRVRVSGVNHDGRSCDWNDHADVFPKDWHRPCPCKRSVYHKHSGCFDYDYLLDYRSLL
jgi:magnesium transporter